MALETPHSVNTLVVTHTVAGLLTLIDVETVRRLVGPVFLSVEAVTGVTRADHPPKVVGALLFTGGASTHINTFRDALAHHKSEALTAFPPVAGAALPLLPGTWILYGQDVVVRTLCTSRGGQRAGRPDGAQLPQDQGADGAEREDLHTIRATHVLVCSAWMSLHFTLLSFGFFVLSAAPLFLPGKQGALDCVDWSLHVSVTHGQINQ